jgi:hypothetical protein
MTELKELPGWMLSKPEWLVVYRYREIPYKEKIRRYEK